MVCGMIEREMKPQPEMHEGPEAFDRLRDAMKKVVAVPHAVIQQRIEAHREQAAKNPRKRGPKRKNT